MTATATASNFHDTTLARRMPGLIGPDADTYLAMLDLQGLAPTSRAARGPEHEALRWRPVRTWRASRRWS